MRELYTRVQLMTSKKRLGVLAIALFFLIFEAIWIFPLSYELSLLTVCFIYAFFLLGVLLCSALKCNSFSALLVITLGNMIGLGLRVWLEWGENSMVQSLTPLNVALTYIPIILITFIGCLYTKHFISKSNS